MNGVLELKKAASCFSRFLYRKYCYQESFISRCWFDVLAACNCCLLIFLKPVSWISKQVIPVFYFLTRNNEVRFRSCIIFLHKGEHFSPGKLFFHHSNNRYYTGCRASHSSTLYHYSFLSHLIFSYYLITPNKLEQGT